MRPYRHRDDVDVVEMLRPLRNAGGEPLTHGLPDDIIRRFARIDPTLVEAIEDALENFEALSRELPELVDAPEREQLAQAQEAFVNFYADDAVNPYIGIAGRGPWIVTAKGAVVHDSGGYGMLGFGHAPRNVLKAMNHPHVMANIMSPSFSQYRMAAALRREIGHRRADGCPYHRFICMNSGSESVTVAARIADINTKLMTDPGGRHAGKEMRILSLEKAFHGRTDRPARFSHSTRKVYAQHLASYRDDSDLITVPPNDTAALQAAFDEADRAGYFFEAFFMEPVMGEGRPGESITREFYDLARQLTEAHGCPLMIDSIQAGLRAQGCLSIVDYPGFEDCSPPDMETYSKALNAGQYPLSVLALSERYSGMYRKGVYGNTMAANPRALDVACAVLEMITEPLRRNIRERGRELRDKLTALADELGGAITLVRGTGLLVSCELDPNTYKNCGHDSSEEYLRQRGICVVHGGKNALRYTPHFGITSEEIDLLVDFTRDALINGPRLA